MQNRRQYQRVAFHEAIGYQRGEAPLNGSLGEDISQGGVRMRLQEFIPLRTIVHLNVQLSNPARSVPVDGQVMWVREMPHSDAYEVGVQFMHTGESTMIKEYVHSRRFEQ